MIMRTMSLNENKIESFLQELLGAQGGVLSIVSSGSEAVTQVLLHHYFDEARLQGKNQFITKEPFLEGLSCVVKKPEENLEALITPRTALVSLEFADSLSGVICPYEMIQNLCTEKGLPLHMDVTSAIGAMPFSLAADFISFDGSALGVPGSGALWSKKPLRPLIYGKREFNEHVLHELCEKAEKACENACFVALEIARLRKRFEKRLEDEIKDMRVLYKDKMRLPHKSYLAFDKVHPNACAFRLQETGCLEGPEGVSFTFLPSHTAAYMDDLVEEIKEAVHFLRTISEGL